MECAMTNNDRLPIKPNRFTNVDMINDRSEELRTNEYRKKVLSEQTNSDRIFVQRILRSVLAGDYDDPK